VNTPSPHTQSNFTHKEFGAIIAPKTLLAFLEIHSTRLYWLGRDDGTGWTGNKKRNRDACKMAFPAAHDVL
jgi:hypothetical protein